MHQGWLEACRRPAFCFPKGATQEEHIKTVLVIEDHPGDRDIYGKILWYNGFHVLFAEDGEAGLLLAQQRHPDLVLLDLELPRMHGLELCSRLKQDNATADIPVVALTGRRLKEFGGNANVLGYAYFLEKPVSPLRVLNIVERLIGRADEDQAEDVGKPEVFRSTPGPKEPPSIPLGENDTDLAPLGEYLVAHVGRVMDRWEELARNEPWFTLPPEDRLDSLPAVVQALARAALFKLDGPEARSAVVNAAVEHGLSRRTQGCPESAIPLELHLLRQAITRELIDASPPHEAVYAAIRALDDYLSIATNASMWGYFREEIEAQGLWETTLDRLTGSSSEPALDG